jgi:hypothetical protein
MAIFDFLKAKTSEDRFAKQVMNGLSERGWSGNIQYDRKRFALILDGTVFFLHNVHREWSAVSPAQKAKELERTIAFILEPKTTDDFEQSAPRLLPGIRNRSAMVSQWLHPALGMDRDRYEGALRPFCDGLAILIAIDQPTAISLINQDTLAKWGRSLEEVLAIATTNLAGRSPPSFELMEGGFYVSCFEDQYDSSRLLIPQLFTELPLRGEPVAIATSRAGIVIAGAEDIDALNAMAAFVERRKEEETRPISNLPLILRGDEWRPFDCSGPDLAALDRLRAMQWLQDYADQKALLEPYLERAGRDVFVATLGGLKVEERIRS